MCRRDDILFFLRIPSNAEQVKTRWENRFLAQYLRRRQEGQESSRELASLAKREKSSKRSVLPDHTGGINVFLWCRFLKSEKGWCSVFRLHFSRFSRFSLLTLGSITPRELSCLSCHRRRYWAGRVFRCFMIDV